MCSEEREEAIDQALVVAQLVVELGRDAEDTSFGRGPEVDGHLNAMFEGEYVVERIGAERDGRKLLGRERERDSGDSSDHLIRARGLSVEGIAEEVSGGEREGSVACHKAGEPALKLSAHKRDGVRSVGV